MDTTTPHFEVKVRAPYPGKKQSHYFARKVGGYGWVEITKARHAALVKAGATEVTE